MARKQQFDRGEKLHHALFLCDQQVPFHDPRAVALATEYARVETAEGRGFDEVIQGGDWADNTGLTTKFVRDPANANRLRLDYRIMRQQHEKLSEAVGWDVPHHWIEGNHEDRLWRYVVEGNPELAWLMVADEDEQHAKLSVMKLTGMDRYENIDYIGPYGETYEIAYGKGGKHTFVFKHGDKHGKYAAARELESVMQNGMSGHNHRNQHVELTTYRGPVGWWSIPALCNIRGQHCPPGYMKGTQLRNWQQGFAEVWFSKERSLFDVQVHQIHEGQMIANGRLFVDVRGE